MSEVRESLEKKKNKKVLLDREIINTMLRAITKDEDVVRRWNNKCRSIKQKQKSIRRIDRHIRRLEKLAKPF